MSQRLRFGIFLAPFHKPGINPTLALQGDLELIQWLDRCGYDEAWLGEHHSAGTELSASPEIMIATAAERTRHIRLGTGVVSVSYHNPLWVAERIVLLDHLTRGRAMLGLGPGSLPTDGIMIGLQQSQTRGLLEDGVASSVSCLLATSRSLSKMNAGTCGKHAFIYDRTPIHCSTLPLPPSPRPRAPSLPAVMASACCRSVPLRPLASMRLHCTGMC